MDKFNFDFPRKAPHLKYRAQEVILITFVNNNFDPNICIFVGDYKGNVKRKKERIPIPGAVLKYYIDIVEYFTFSFAYLV